MAIDFPGVDEYINCGSGATLDNIAAMSLAGWIYFDTLTGAIYPSVAAKYNAGAARGWIFNARGDGVGLPKTLQFFMEFDGATDGGWTAGNILSAGVWCHIAVTYNRGATANDPIFYLNGAPQTTAEYATPAGAAVSDAADSLVFAWDTATSYLDGKMEDVRIFNRILSAQEVAILASGYRGPLGGEAGWWMLDTADAITHWDGASLTVNTNYIPDRSSNGNTGNPTGTPLGVGSTCPRMSTWLPRAIYNFLKTVSCAGAMAWTGVVSKATSKIVAGAQTNTGTAAKLMLLQRTVMSGAITFAGGLVKKTGKILAGIIQWVGTVIFGGEASEVFVQCAEDSLTVHADQGSLTFKCPPDDLTMRGLEG